MRPTIVRRVRIALLPVVGAHAGHARRAAARRRRRSSPARRLLDGLAGRRLALADLRRQLRQPSPQPAHPDHAGQRQRGWCRSGRSRPARSATSRRPRCCATTSSMSPGRRTSPGRSTRAPAARSGAIAASCRPNLTACCGLVNRGFGVLGDKLFMTTLDAHLLALDMKTGAIVWDATLEDYKTGYAVDDRAARRQGQGDRRRRRRRVRHPRLHRRLRRADRQARVALLHHSRARASRATTRGPATRGRPAAPACGSPAPTTPSRTCCFYGTGNPGPDYHSESREGDNLYSDSLVALDADTGKLQLALPVHAARRARLGRDRGADPRRPHHRRPAAQGRDVRQPQRLLLHARSHHRQGDRRQAVRRRRRGPRRSARDGRPVLLPGHTPDEKGEVTCPDITGGTNFWPPTFDPATRTVLRQRARSVRDLLRVEAGIQAGRALHRRRRPARAARRTSRPTARCAPSIRRPASASGSSST